MSKIPVIWDMETAAPDDFITLLLVGHPLVDLRAVTITPGSSHQVGLVRNALERLGVDVPVGAFNLKHQKSCVSGWHYKVLGAVAPSTDAENGAELLLRMCNEEMTLVSGAPLNNLGMGGVGPS